MTLNQFIKEFGMSKIIGVVKSIKKNTVASGPSTGKPYYKVMLDDKLLFAWTWPVIKDIKLGAAAEIVVEKAKKGDYLNILSSIPIVSADDNMSEHEDEVPFDKDEEPEDNIKTIEDQEKSYRAPQAAPPRSFNSNPEITRMSALKTAIEYLAYCKPTDTSKWKPVSDQELIECAEVLAKYIFTGELES